MKLAVTPYKVKDIKELCEAGADIFIIGNSQFANRLANSFSLEEIIKANKVIKRYNEIHK